MIDLKLYTGNPNKQNDFAKLGLDIPLADDIVDIDEVLSDDDLVVLAYKAKEVPPFHLVDDTVISINGEAITDIKFQLDDIKKNATFAIADMIFKVNLAYHDGRSIFVFSGEVHGLIVPSLASEEDVFGFDDVFVPDGQTGMKISYHHLKSTDIDSWKKFNARSVAINKLLANDAVKVIGLDELEEWKGEYQK